MKYFIDQAVVNGLEEIKIIHGVGEGILVKTVRNYLKKDKNIKGFRRGIYGEGDRSGLKSINGQPVDYIDGIPTMLTRVVGNVATGFIVRNDLSLALTYICKQGNTFAHGETLHKAREALLEKLFDDMPTEERIDAFCKEFKPGVKRHSMDFFSWHHRLTGSCEQGRREFARQHDVDIDSDEMTPEEFFDLTRNSYGSSIIRQTEKEFAVRNGEIAEVEE